MAEETRFTMHLHHLNQYEFNVKFDWESVADIVMDEPPPLGRQLGANASRLLAAAVANCLSASLLFCLSKNTPPAGGLSTAVTCILTRNEKKRLRIGGFDVTLQLDTSLFDATRLKRCFDMFEDFCTVTGSIRQGIPVKVTVIDPAGSMLHQTD